MRKTRVTINEGVVAKMTKFKYFRTIIQSNGKIDEDVICRNQARWLK